MIQLSEWCGSFRRTATLTDGEHKVPIAMTLEDAESPDALEIFRLKLNAALEQLEKLNEHGNRS
jgi:hypothetical protein